MCDLIFRQTFDERPHPRTEEVVLVVRVVGVGAAATVVGLVQLGAVELRLEETRIDLVVDVT
jgi:hypothetical protein